MGRRRKRDGGWLATLILIALVIGIKGDDRGANLWPLAIAVVVVPPIVWFLLRRWWRERLAEGQRRRLAGHTLDDLDALSGLAFEEWVTFVLDEDGFECENIKATGDFGLDVIAVLDGVRIGIQVKRYKSNVGNDAVQQAVAGSDFWHCDLAVVVTQSFFTTAAVRQAHEGDTPVILVDRDSIEELASVLRAAVASA